MDLMLLLLAAFRESLDCVSQAHAFERIFCIKVRIGEYRNSVQYNMCFPS